MAQKRRIVPQLISTAQATPAQDPSTAPLSPAPAADRPSPTEQKGGMTLKEQSEYAMKHLGPGRRIYVELSAEKNEINWRKLLKERGAVRVPAPRDPSETAAEVPFKGAPKRSAATSVFNSVIQKLEQQYMINLDDESDEEEDEPDEGETPNEGAEASDMEPEAVEGFDDQYDMDDAFIDDSEFHDYYGGDRRKAKYTGFFINKGEIEKTGELVDVERPSPPKKRRKAKAEKALDEEVPKEAAVEAKPKKAKRLREQGAALEGQEVKKVKKKVNKAEKAAAPGQEGPGLQTAADAPPSAAPVPATNVNTDGSSTPHEPPAQSDVPAAAQVAQQSVDNTAAEQVIVPAADAQLGPAQQGPAEPTAEESLQDTRQAVRTQQPAQHEKEPAGGSDASGAAEPNWSLPQALQVPAGPRKIGGAKGDDFVPPKEVSEAIETLREAAAAAEPPKKDGHRAMPKPVNQLLPGFACAVMREAEEDKAVLKHAVDAAMCFLEPFTTRANLLVRIKDQWERARSGVAAADKVLREEIAKRAQVLKQAAAPMEVDADDDFVTTSPRPSQSDAFMDAGLEEIVYSYISKRLLLEGGGSGPDKIFSEAAAMFLPGTITEDSLREVFARKAAGGSRSPRNVQKERAPTGQAPITAEAPATGNVAAAPVQPPVAATLESSPAASADVTQSDQPQRAQSGGPAGAKTQPVQKGASAGQDAAGADATLRRSSRASADFEARRDAGKPVSALSDSEYVEWIQGLLQLAVASGGDKHALAEGSASFKHGTAKSIIHSVLMTAGKEGMTISSIINTANDMGLTGNTPWDMKDSKKSHISSIVNNEPAFAHVGKSQYALAAFEGVVNLPHKRKQKDVSASQAPQSSQQPLPSAPQATEAAAAPASASQQQFNGIQGPVAVLASASQPPPQSDAAASAPAAVPDQQAAPSDPLRLAAIAALQLRPRNFAQIPPAVLGALGGTPLLQGLSQEAIAALGVSGGAPAASLAPATTTAASTAEGAVPASRPASGGSQRRTGGSSGSQNPSQNNGGPKKYVRPLIGS